ncbi:MAG TPA: heme exporter protein CcmB [Candidatus Binatia bacterium]|nr:heme exporter protein CcmB [Candidatus Binatia bacterium]
MGALAAVIRRELQLAARRRSEWIQPLLFYAIVALLFALGGAPSAGWLRVAAPSVLWVGALLAALLSLDRLFRADLEDGTLEQMLLSPAPLALLAAGKLAAAWLAIGVPLTAMAPLLALGLGLSPHAAAVLLASLALGLPALVLLAGFAAALTVALPRAGLLLPLLVLPLVAPVVIFGAGAVRAAASGLPADAPLYFLAALLALCACGVPLAAGAALRNAFE